MDLSNYNLINLLMILSGIAIFGFFSYAGIISLLEREGRASSNFFTLGLVVSAIYILIGISNFSYKEVVSIILFSFIALLFLIFILPIRTNKRISSDSPHGKIDERDTMFSRNELKKDTNNYIEYYKSQPENESIDNTIKDNPGLLSPSSGNYDKLMFSSSKASFFTIDALKLKVNGNVSSEKVILDKNDISKYIKNWTKKLGALNVGFTELRDYHKYSYRGRGEYYGNEVTMDHSFAIAFTVEMDFDAVKSGPLGPIVMESAQQYLESGAIAVQLAEFIRQLGYPARAHIDGNYEVVCPLVAKDAGLGEIGRMGLLMTPSLGPRVRIAVVTTDLPLNVDKPANEPSVIDFCTNCKKCAVNCPSNAISYNDREDINGVIRWQINQESCFDFWTKSGTDCGRCMSVCPYSHPDNLLHNIVRFGIKNSSIFSRLALYFDDAIYGKNPTVKKPADWMSIS